MGNHVTLCFPFRREMGLRCVVLFVLLVSSLLWASAHPTNDDAKYNVELSAVVDSSVDLGDSNNNNNNMATNPSKQAQQQQQNTYALIVNDNLITSHDSSSSRSENVEPTTIITSSPFTDADWMNTGESYKEMPSHPKHSTEDMMDAPEFVVQNDQQQQQNDIIINTRKQQPQQAMGTSSEAMELSSLYIAELSKLMQSQKLLVAVVSAPSHFSARRAIRNTWGRKFEVLGIPVKFFIGVPSTNNNNNNNNTQELAELEAAIAREQGIVRFDSFTESYHNLTAKALEIFSWAWDNGYRTVMKVDDDTYLRMHQLARFIREHMPLDSVYGGQFVPSKTASTDESSKWYMKDQYPADIWPSYANGPGVLIGSKALEFLSLNKRTLPQYRVDDVALAIWFEAADLQLTHANMFCDCYMWTLHPNTVWVNPVNYEEMERLEGTHHFVLTSCKETTLCEGGPYVPDWESFAKQTYKDIVLRL